MENTNEPKNILLIDIKDSFEKAFIFPTDLTIVSLYANKKIEIKIIY